MSILEPIISEIYGVFPAAMGTYNKIDASIRAEHENRTAACCVRDHAWMGFQRELDGRTGFKFDEVKGLPILIIRDQLVIRVKKVDENGRHRNYQTEQQKNFDGGADLDGIPPAALRVVVGYQPDAAFSKVDRVTVRRPKGDWVSQIVDIEGAASWVDITPAQLPFGSSLHSASR